MADAKPLIYLVRHGQTDWNAEGRFQGQRDIPLNDIGRKQATDNGTMLSEILGKAAQEFDFVSSPLSRTRETMERLRAAMTLEPADYRTDRKLIELSFGDWEGHTFSELKMLFPDAISRRESDKWNFLPPGHDAESYEILSSRISSWMASVARPTVCVTHGGVIRSIFKLTGTATAEKAANIDIHQDCLLRLESGHLAWIEP